MLCVNICKFKEIKMTTLITNGVGLITRTTNVAVIVKVMAKPRIHITKILVVTEKTKAIAKEQMPQ